MKKLISIDYQEYISYVSTIEKLRNDISIYQKQVHDMRKEIEFLKDSGENILVIVKDGDNPNTHEYKSTEKNILTEMVSENHKLRERYDEISRSKDNLENQKQLLILKYKDMENIYKMNIQKLENYIEYLENRSFMDRMKNKTKNINNETYISYVETELLEQPKTVYTDEEIKKLEDSAKNVQKPRGWHFKEEFIDSEGNVYHKGKLQPHLKK